VLIESRAIGAGQTGRMTGQALGWWTHSFQDAETRLGAEKATVLASSIKCAAFSAAYNGLSHAVRRCAGDALLSGCGHAAGLGKDGDLGLPGSPSWQQHQVRRSLFGIFGTQGPRHPRV